MATLREIAAEYRALMDVLIESEGEIDNEIEAWRKALTAEFEDKVGGYCHVISEIGYMAEIRKAEAERLAESAALLNARLSRLKDALKLAMQDVGIKKYSTDIYDLSVCNNASVPIEITGPIPDAFLQPPKPREPDKRMITEALKSGMPIDFAKLGERGTHLRIK